jgi:signal transduction histidine kinase
VLTLGTAASLFVPGMQLRVVAPQLDLVLDTLTTVVTIGIAALGWARYRQGGEPVAAFQAAAFLVLAIANSLNVALVMLGLDARAGMALTAPGQAPPYVSTVMRLVAAWLLVAGGMASLRWRRLGHPVAIVLGAAVTSAGLIALIELSAPMLPSLGSVAAPVTPGAPQALPEPTPLGAAAQVLGAALFLWASALSRRLYRREHSIGDGYLSAGLVFAAFAQLEAAVYPGTYTGLVTSGDALRLAFDLTLLLGIQAEASAALRGLRLANADLARLQVVELERAALAERARLARELHDGLAQDLWLAKLKTGRLAALPELGPEGSQLTSELDAALDAGLAEARGAVAAMRLTGEAAQPLRELLARSVDDFADRFGLPVELTCEPDLPALPPRVQAAALRIVQEALSNVRRHADATVVRVRAAVEDGLFVMSIGDNGRGFDPDAVGATAYGLVGMKERARLVGGEVRVDSAPRDGTRVMLRVPVSPATDSDAVGAA